MPIRRDFDLTFDTQTYIDFHSQRLERLLKNPSVCEGLEAAVAEAPDICKPAAIYASFPIEQFLHEKVKLADGTRIGGGPVVAVVGGAEELVLAVCTVGEDVDHRIKELSQQKKGFQMMVLDELATWAVDQIRLQLFQDIADEYAQKGWRASTCLSPGESTWSIEEQRIIFDLLDTSPIDVTLSDSFLMRPLKSLSLLFGVGSQPMGVEGASNCDFCSMKERCRYRYRRVQAPTG